MTGKTIGEHLLDEAERQERLAIHRQFAAVALNAFIVSERDPNATMWDYSYWAKHAMRCADAMLAEYDKREKEREDV